MGACATRVFFSSFSFLRQLYLPYFLYVPYTPYTLIPLISFMFRHPSVWNKIREGIIVKYEIIMLIIDSLFAFKTFRVRIITGEHTRLIEELCRKNNFQFP